MLPDLTNAVLLPIDMQCAFDAAPWPKRWNVNGDRNGLSVLGSWRKAGRPVVHVRHDSVVEGSSLGPGHGGNQFRPGFEPLALEPLVSKSVNSAFIGTDLDLRLRRMKAQSIITFGISTDMCVSTTVRMGANMGWRMILVADACDCFELKDQAGQIIPARMMHDAHVATLAQEFCQVITTEELLALVEGR
jgi:nicotinamidase-related amidase